MKRDHESESEGQRVRLSSSLYVGELRRVEPPRNTEIRLKEGRRRILSSSYAVSPGIEGRTFI